MADLFVKRVAEGIQRSPSLLSFLRPLANWYSNTSGYRQVGLRYDDLFEEEREEVGKALKRLSPKESYDRIYRIRRAVQCSYQHKLLPKSEWTKPEEVSALPLPPKGGDFVAETRKRLGKPNSLRQILGEMQDDSWLTTHGQDVPYLRPLIEQVQVEMAEQKALDSLEVVKKH